MKILSVVALAFAAKAVSPFSVALNLNSRAMTTHPGRQASRALAASTEQITGDPRIDEADDQFKAIIGGIGAAFAGLAKYQGGRATHTYGITARGRLTMLSNPDVPKHKFFSPNHSYPVLARHANIKGKPDDAIRDGRGLTLRLLNGEADAATDSLDLNDGILDVLTSTGPSFFINNAVDFGRWVRSDMAGKTEMMKDLPKMKPIVEEILRNPDSFTKLHYYSEPSYYFVAENGKRFYMRYRIINADRSADTGFIPSEEFKFPQDYIDRPASDKRSKTYLQDDFRDRVNSPSGVVYLMQVQLRRASSTNTKRNNKKMDCTIPWDESKHPLRDVALIHLDEIVPTEKVEPLSFSPFNAPPELGLVLAEKATDTASINHLRSVVYEFSAKTRNNEPLPDYLQDLIPGQ